VASITDATGRFQFYNDLPHKLASSSPGTSPVSDTPDMWLLHSASYNVL